MFNDKIQHAQFKLPKPTVHAKHPLRDKTNHARLLEYLQSRLMADESNRNARVERYTQIDRDVMGWMKLNDEDKKRQAKHEQDGSPQATTVSLPLTWVHLDDMMTYYAQTFAPNRGMFYHTADPESSDEAAALVGLMNNHAIYGSYYRHMLRTIFSILKYNKAGLMTTWATDYGPRLITDAQGQAATESVPIFSGNKIKAIDMYNFLFDAAVEPEELHKEGEWCALVEMKSHYWLKNKCLEGTYFNCESLLENEGGQYHTKYYKSPPVEARMDADESTGSGSRVNWYAWMSSASTYLANNAFELVHVYVRINPNDFGLIEGSAAEKAARNKYEIWRFTICNDEQIIGATFMPNIHNHLPAYFGIMNDDFMGDATKSPAEILNPLQQFSSFLLNVHVLANRKNLFGTTFYDPTCVDFDKIPAGEVAGRVPLKPAGYGKDIRTMIQRDDHQLDTKQTLQDLQGIMGIIDQFFPTQSLPGQIAGIDRAIDSQVAAVQQGSNRRQHKGARLLDDTMMRPMRYSLYYNIVQFQEDGADVLDYFSGKSQKVDLSSLREESLIALIGQGLKAIDRQMVAGNMRDLIFALIQAPAATQPQADGSTIDILAMLGYWCSMMDIDANLEQFRKQAPQPAPGAVDPATGQPVAAAGVTPATAPAAIAGGPIYS